MLTCHQDRSAAVLGSVLLHVFWEREFSASRTYLEMNDRRCVIWQKSKERQKGEERRKDFGMMDGYVKENSNLHSSLGRESVSFFQWKNARERQSERERDIEVAE